MTLPLVGFIGRARSGKDTAADRLVDKLGYSKAAMADPLREMAAAIDPIVDAYAEDGQTRRVRYTEAVDRYGYEAAKDLIPELRRFLQRLGTEGIRDHVGADFWIRQAERRILAADGPLVFTDIRFHNEADMIARNGGVLVRVVRPSLDVGNASGHTSESLLDTIGYDWLIRNVGTLDEFHTDVDHLADALETGL